MLFILPVLPVADRLREINNIKGERKGQTGSGRVKYFHVDEYLTCGKVTFVRVSKSVLESCRV